MKSSFIAALAAVLLAGCGTTPTDPAKRSIYFTEQAQERLIKGIDEFAIIDVFSAIELPGGPDNIRAMFAKNPAAKSAFVSIFQRRIGNISGAVGASMESDYLEKIQASRILSAEDNAALATKFEKTLVEGNESGRIQFLMTSDVLKLKPLSSSGQRKIIYARTLKSYIENRGEAREMGAMLEYLHTLGPTSEEYRQFKSSLTKFNTRANELPLLSSIDPGFAERRRAEITLVVSVAGKNTDRIFLDDLKSNLSQRVKGVSWVPEDSESAMQLVVERVRNQEREVAPSSRTITYGYYDVDLVSAALLMPKGASYQFDLRTNSTEIEYGYVVSSWRKGKKLSEEVVRGKIGGESRSCENARIVNVFGGVSSAGFQANDQMRELCGSSTTVSIDSLRNQVFDKLTEQILQISEVSKVHQMN